MKIRVTGVVTYQKSRVYDVPDGDNDEAFVEAEELFLQDFADANEVNIVDSWGEA